MSPDTTLNTWPNTQTKSVRLVRQSEATECGIACLAMVLGHFGKHVDLRSLREKGGVSLNGSTLQDIMNLATEMGLGHRAVRVELFALTKLATPAILHWDMSHFVVLERATARHVDIVDPARGRRRLSVDEFSKHFTGVALECWPLEGFARERSVRRLRWRDILRGAVGLKRQMLVILLFSLITGFVGLIAPQYIQYAIDQAVLKQDSDSLFLLAIGFAVVMLFGLGVSVLKSFAILHLTTSLLFQFRQNLFQHLLFLPSKYFESRTVGDIISRMDSYESIQESFTVDTFNAIIQGLFALIIGVLLFLYSWKIALIIFAYFVVNFLIGLAFFPAQRRRTMDAIVADAAAESRTIEAIRGHHSIRALGLERRMLGQWLVSQADAVNARLLPSKLGIWQSVPLGLLNIVDQIAIPAFALYLVVENELTLGMFYAVNAYKSQFTQAMETLVSTGFQLAFNAIHLERLGDIALEDPEQPITAFERKATPREDVQGEAIRSIGSITLKDGAFRHAPIDPLVFEDVDLTIDKGERVCLLGKSGAGKTTLLKVMSSILAPTAGRFEVNGQPLRRDQLSSFRARIGVVMQQDSLFAGSIAFNVARYGDDIDMERVVEACERADIHEEITAMPMHYETLIGDMGSVLSTGQMQRVILARAFYGDPDFLFLDEGTVHLDAASEQRILERLKASGLGILFAAHNEAPLRISHKAFRLDQGRLQLVVDVAP